MRIIGVDPGTRVVGYGIVDTDGQRTKLVACGVVKTNTKAAQSKRLLTIFEGLDEAVRAHVPEVACVEDVFSGSNARTALRIGEGRGVALVALAHSGLEIHSLSPATIKKSVTGNGRADKSQVQHMVALILGLDEAPEPYDATDALAAAICLAHRLA
jgi:crossover junction endodeoxyribonuclease RuvC